MHAYDRFIPEWFNRIRSRQITLPRFQRFEAWGNNEVSGLLTTVLRGLPSGAALILEVGDEEKFRSRTMVTAPESGDKVNEQLLDGQQRLTALWRALNDTYEYRTYLVGFEENPSGDGSKIPYVYGQSRWSRDGRLYPLWVDNPADCLRRDHIPVKLLRPDLNREEVDEWIEQALPDDVEDKFKAYKEISSRINELGTNVREFNLPYLSLPAKTPKDVALDVFVKMNTSSVKLSSYEIVVALVEGNTGESLHELLDALHEEVPRAADYADMTSLVLDAVALMQDRVPSQASYQRIDFGRLISEWDALVDGVRGLVSFLEEEFIFDDRRLPSYTVLPVIAALWHRLPTKPDDLGNARILLRKYLWRACLTGRYEQSSTSNAIQDYRGLRNAIEGKGLIDSIPVMNDDISPLPTVEMLMQAGWPRRKTILGRGLLALSLRTGAEDLADGKRASVSSITSKDHPREYHHLFPASTLSDAGIIDEQVYLALNCALITWRTNRAISNKDPITYLNERADSGELGEPELRRRLQTHLVPYPQLAVGYDGLSDDERRERVKVDYKHFIEARAELMVKAVEMVCSGRPLEMNKLFDEF